VLCGRVQTGRRVRGVVNTGRQVALAGAGRHGPVECGGGRQEPMVGRYWPRCEGSNAEQAEPGRSTHTVRRWCGNQNQAGEEPVVRKLQGGCKVQV